MNDNYLVILSLIRDNYDVEIEYKFKCTRLNCHYGLNFNWNIAT